METVNVKRARKLNWSQAVVDELRNSYLEFRSVIDGRLGVTLTNYQKEQTWRSIQERINAQSKETRTLDEIKKKLSDMKTAIKKKERERRQLSTKTGGGPAPILNEQDEKVTIK
ncbi:uncharacterized protein LOC132733690 [Ruditapes philippinarum]|uniref:uncharacterized protein LOC132733690 n=1 Tax=Ruditapes philippinarum TaxID=129788 RepID=UPI00295BF74B|nr:uncharacterized protein LOC132733690 [Ruditapes philippinarum]